LFLCLRSEFIRAFLASFAILVTVYYVAVIVDAIRTAKRFGNQYLPNKYNKVIVYIGVFLFVGIVSNSISAVIKYKLIQAYKFPSGSMEPTLLKGDHILVDRSKSARNPHKGDLIVFEYPEDPTKDFVKRVVAMEGDTVEIRNKALYVNGKAAIEPYAVHNEADTIPASQNPRDNFGPQVIPPGSFFVMGDNRDRSYDSRFWGVVAKKKVKGTVKSIYWSWDKEKSAVRWNRIGTKVL
jgi:signal peptidase I